MKRPEPVTLYGRHVRLEPLHADHEADLQAAAGDGELWRLRVTSVPEPDQTAIYIANALMGQQDGTMLPFVVRDLADGTVVGSTRYHDIVTAIDRVEIGYTWYARRVQRSAINTESKLLLLGHAFDSLGCKVVGFRTDHMNFASQRAIERLGAKKDGVIRHHALRRDGSVRDTVMYSITSAEWPDVKSHLAWQLERPR
jgi:RimJ/RimL family protein N-acetyltransferase